VTTLKVQRAGTPGTTLSYYKYDALIVACAIRYKVEAFITTDPGQSKLALLAGLNVKTPETFQSLQLSLPTVSG
jgi:hypothetical protein